MKDFPGQEKVREYHFHSGKKLGKSQGITKFKKKTLLVNGFLEFFFPQIASNLYSEKFLSNIYGLRFFLKIKSASMNICIKFWNCRWMKMAKIRLPKGS